MKSILRNWKTSLTGIIGIVAIIVSTWLPEYQVQLDKAVVILMGLGLLRAEDARPTVKGPPSYLHKMLIGILMLGCLSLCSCAGDKFMGLTGDQWGTVAMNTGKELGKQLPGAAMQAYATERMKPSSKQPLPSVNPAAASNQSPLLLPPAEPEPKSESWFSGFRLF